MLRLNADGVDSNSPICCAQNHEIVIVEEDIGGGSELVSYVDVTVQRDCYADDVTMLTIVSITTLPDNGPVDLSVGNCLRNH